MVSQVFTGSLYPALAWKVFFEARRVIQKISFGGGRVRFLLPACVVLSVVVVYAFFFPV